MKPTTTDYKPGIIPGGICTAKQSEINKRKRKRETEKEKEKEKKNSRSRLRVNFMTLFVVANCQLESVTPVNYS